MNYLKTYCNLIRKAEQRGYTKKKAKEQGLYVESPYAKEICEKYGLHYVSIIRVILKQRNHHKGWKATRRPRNKDDK